MRRLEMRDLLVWMLLAVGEGCWSWWALGKMLELHIDLLDNGWFQADICRVIDDLINAVANTRSSVHPLFCLATNPLVLGVQRLGISGFQAGRLVYAVVAGLWLGTFFRILRRVQLALFDAVLFSLLVAVSASGIFFTSVIESFLFGSLSISVALWVVSASKGHSWYVVANILTLAFTTTNWLAGMAVTWATHSWNRAFAIISEAFLIVIILWCVQVTWYPSTALFLLPWSERHYISSAWVPQQTRVFFLSAIVSPPIGAHREPGSFSIQHAPLESLDAVGRTATVLWGILLAWGGACLLVSRFIPRAFGLALVLVVLSQLSVYAFYSDGETFLYSLHWVPALVVVAAMGMRSPWEYLNAPLRVLTILLIVSAAITNLTQYHVALKSAAQRLSLDAPRGERP